MSRFKKGDVVYRGRGENLREMVVEEVIDNPLIPVYQYSFEAPYDGFACGEQSIRATKDGPDLKLGECFKRTEEEENNFIDTKLNSILHGAYKVPENDMNEMARELGMSSVFFKPDLIFCKWLKKYANGRMIIDVGAGSGHLVRMLKMVKASVIGLEPNFDFSEALKWRSSKGMDIDPNEILPWTIQRAKNMIEKMGAEKVMLVFARPCHSNFVYEGIRNMPKGMEALYITVPENIKEYNDLGTFQNKAVLLQHEGKSEDNEVVYSVVR